LVSRSNLSGWLLSDTKKVPQQWEYFCFESLVIEHLFVEDTKGIAAFHGRLVLASKRISVVVDKYLKESRVNGELQFLWIGVGHVVSRQFRPLHGNVHGKLVFANQYHLLDAIVVKDFLLPDRFILDIHPVIWKGLETDRLEVFVDFGSVRVRPTPNVIEEGFRPQISPEHRPAVSLIVSERGFWKEYVKMSMGLWVSLGIVISG